MSYVLATTGSVVKWYREVLDDQRKLIGHELHDVLDLGKTVCYADKDTAKAAAQAMGLKTWRYVKI